MSPVSAAIPLGQFAASQQAFDANPGNRPSSLPVPNPTRSFWIDTPHANPLAAEGSEGPFTDDADVCIIGSGITGVSAAYHLATAVERGDIPTTADKPLRVLILEARDFCSGATGRNGGHLTPAVFLDFCGYQAKYGTDQAVQALELENHTASEIVKLIRNEGWTEAVDLVAGGHTTTFFLPSELTGGKADFEAAKLAGLDLKDVRWLTKEEMEAKYGVLYPGVEIGGFNLWPLKFVTQLYGLAKGMGNFQLNIHTRTPATSITSSASPSRHWAVHTPRGVLNCAYIIHATNAYASHLLPHMAGPAGIIPTRGQVMALRASVSSELLTKCSWDGNEGFEYWFPRPVSGDEKPLVILGGGREVQPDFEYYQADDSSVTESVGVALRKFLPAVFPGKFAPGTEPEEEWTGIMGFTKLKDPFVGPVIDKSDADGGKFQGQYISAGYSGHGMPRAFSCAAVVASMVAADITGTAWQIPQWFPAAFLTYAELRDISTDRK
ncbi:FAD dependent oxidoreductase [Mycena rosella]|uniref:FAD dependent oxidoreductase n=1 Tax=Mycena rosella TaxID=1033263 RepID=A0AAD7DLH1_MYCRO|nr:FAD dependent oxidoreductase [Mycena rosella]